MKFLKYQDTVYEFFYLLNNDQAEQLTKVSPTKGKHANDSIIDLQVKDCHVRFA